VRALFVMIGADPCHDVAARNDRARWQRFVRTGAALAAPGEKSNAMDAAEFSPYQTDLPGVFAVGDVRSGSVKRVASAVGEGSVVVQAVHEYLARLGELK
jgi:thioredoxin reductase (NADPH)